MVRRRKDTTTLRYMLLHGLQGGGAKRSGGKKTRGKKKDMSRANKRRRVIAMVLMISSLLVFLYPIVATNHNNKRLSDLSDAYADKVSVSPHVDSNAEELKKAEDYNEWLSKNRFIPPPIGKDREHEYYSKYDNILSQPDGTMGTISIPSIDVKLPIYHGTSEGVLYEGAGHLYGTYLPVGGAGRTAAISAHAGMVNATMFDNLPRMKIGDVAVVQVRDRKLAYRMVSSEVVSPDRSDAIPFDDRDLLVLITCTPYGINTERLIVVLERTELGEPYDVNTNTPRVWQWWMTASIALFAAFIILFVIAWRRSGRR